MNTILQKYQTLYRKLAKSLRNGSFYNNRKSLSRFNRLQRYERRLRRAGIAVATTAVLLAGAVELGAQSPVKEGGNAVVNTFTTNGQTRVDVAKNADGDYVVTWTSSAQENDYGTSIYARMYSSDGTPKGNEFLVPSETYPNDQNSEVAIDDEGNFVIIWHGYGGIASASEDIYGRRFDKDGNALGSDFTINQYTTGTQWVPEIAMDADGDFVVVWESIGQLSGRDNYVRLFNSDRTAKGDEFLINTNITTNFQVGARVAMDDDGDFAIAWLSRIYGYTYEIYGQRYDNTGATVGSDFLINTPDSANFDFLQSVDLDDDGDFAISWSSYGVTSYTGTGAYVRVYDANNTAFSDAFRIADSIPITYAYITKVETLIDDDGDILAIWDYPASNTLDYTADLYLRRYDNTGIPISEPIVINDITLQNGGYASADIDDDDALAVAWINNMPTDAGADVYLQRFSDSGATPVQLLTSATFEAYPNPFVDQLIIEDGIGQASIYSVTGQLVHQVEITQPKQALDLSHLSKGSYTVRVRKADGSAWSRKLVK